MQGTLNLFARSAPVCNGIEFKIRTLGEIMAFGEEEYFKSTGCFIADPWDYMYPLSQMGIDFEAIDEFQLFLMMYSTLTPEICEFLFGDTLSFEGMTPAVDNQTGQVLLVDPNNEERVFTSITLMLIAEVIRKVHYYKHEVRKVGNREAKIYFLEQAAKRARRNQNKPPKPILEPLVRALVNAPEFPYNYQTCEETTIYQFLTSVQQIPKRLNWNFVMHGVHVGMIDAKKVDWQKLDWLS